MAESARDFQNRELLRLLPRVLRARDFHLYLEGGTRLTDLWLCGGRAILGHKPPGVLQELKNSGERGLFSPLPHPLERRLEKALAVFFPGRAFRFYTSPCSLRRAFENAGLRGNENAPLRDPAFPGGAGPGAPQPDIPLWRPFLPAAVLPPAFVPVLPCPLGPEVLAVEKSAGASLPPGDLVPPALLAPAVRALYDLAAAVKEKVRAFPRAEKALKAGPWRKKGIYLSVNPDMEREKYRRFFLNFLEGGFLLPPDPREPAILPRSMSQGEEAKLAELLAAPCA